VVTRRQYVRVGRSVLLVLILCIVFFFLLFRPPPCSTLFPYTTLFRSSRSLASCATPSNSWCCYHSRCRSWPRMRFPIFRTRHPTDRKSTRLNSSHDQISYAVFCLKKKKNRRW